jgi:putative phosphoesterase
MHFRHYRLQKRSLIRFSSWYRPEPSPCVFWIRANATHAVRGDHDQAVARGVSARCPPDLSGVSEATDGYTRRVLYGACFDYLGELAMEKVVELEGATFYLTHGAPSDNLGRALPLVTMKEDGLTAEIEDLGADVVLLGHTHVPAIRRVGATVLINPGSLAQPRHGSPSPS